MQNLFVEAEADEGTQFDVHLCVSVVMSQIDSLDAAIEKLECFRSGEILKITRDR